MPNIPSFGFFFSTIIRNDRGLYIWTKTRQFTDRTKDTRRLLLFSVYIFYMEDKYKIWHIYLPIYQEIGSTKSIFLFIYDNRGNICTKHYNVKSELYKTKLLT